MITKAQLDAHPFFEPWQDGGSGVVSYLLNQRCAPLQKSFYFVNNSYHHTGQWLWFEAAHPPAPYKCLAAVSLNPDKPELRYFPQASISAETPLLLTDGSILLQMQDNLPQIHRLYLDGTVELFAALPEQWLAGRHLYRAGTHYTLSSDSKWLLVDGKIGNVWFVAVIDMESRQFHLIKEFPRHFNHAQFSPTQPDLFSIAQDHWRDPYTGQQFGYDHRIWLMAVDGSQLEPVEPTYYHSPQNRGNEVSHEFWAEDGTLCWIRYREGAYEMNTTNRHIESVWQRPLCHVHCDRSRRYWVGDQSPYLWPKPCEVRFFDRTSGTETLIVTGMPQPRYPRRIYHIDPHPRFIAQDSCIVYTTTVKDTVDLALVPMVITGTN
ncbi:MAG: oligogalacturonate lyase family protein [Verrucomicrobia bacterium]|nr:oligogalacturonate lyase family protein [Verrucomicrobiota bacterium]